MVKLDACQTQERTKLKEQRTASKTENELKGEKPAERGHRKALNNRGE